MITVFPSWKWHYDILFIMYNVDKIISCWISTRIFGLMIMTNNTDGTILNMIHVVSTTHTSGTNCIMVRDDRWWSSFTQMMRWHDSKKVNPKSCPFTKIHLHDLSQISWVTKKQCSSIYTILFYNFSICFRKIYLW